jgi:hypothetical protein
VSEALEFCTFKDLLLITMHVLKAFAARTTYFSNFMTVEILETTQMPQLRGLSK